MSKEIETLRDAFWTAWTDMDLPRYTSPESSVPADVSDADIEAEFTAMANRHNVHLPSLIEVVKDGTSPSGARWLKFAAMSIAAEMVAQCEFYVGDED